MDRIRCDLELLSNANKTFKQRKLKQEQWLRLCSSQRQTCIYSHRMYVIVNSNLFVSCSVFFLSPFRFFFITSLLLFHHSNAHFDADFKITCIVTYEKDEVNILVWKTGRKKNAYSVSDPHIYSYQLIHVHKVNELWLRLQLMALKDGQNSSSSRGKYHVFVHIETVVNWHIQHLLRGQR